MRTNLSEALLAQNILLQRKPRVAIKILNDTQEFWLTTHSDVDPDDGLPIFTNIKTTKISSQKVTPEKGFSTIGGSTITVQDTDREFTDLLRSIKQAPIPDSIYNNKAEIWIGFEGMDFADYGILFTFIVGQVNNDWTSYTIPLTDIQRIQRVTMFTPKETKLLGVIEDDIPVDLTTATVLNGSGIMELLDSSIYSLVEHGPDWDIDPNQTIGYFQLAGVDTSGADTVETFSFTGFDGGNPNRVTGVTRSRFSTSAIAAKGTISGGNTAVTEYVYLDLPVPDMVYALLTGFGIPGNPHLPSGIPSHWNAGVAQSDVDLPSFENIGNDLDNLPFSFRGEKDENCKHFIANELLRANNLLFKINAFGQFSLSRFESVPQSAAPAGVFAEGQIKKNSLNVVTRDATAIRNRFLINWEWRDDLQRYMRTNAFFDDESEEFNNVETDFLVLSFKGIRNRSRDILNNLENIAEGIRARYSNASELITFSVPMAFGLQYEVGDIVGVDLAEFPDFANESDDAEVKNLAKSVEIQSVQFNLETQMITYSTYSTTGTPTPINFNESGNVVGNVDHTGWTEFTAALDTAGISYTVSGTGVNQVLTVTSSGTLPGTPNLNSGSNRYYYEFDDAGTKTALNVVFAPGTTTTVTNNFVLDAGDIQASGATITAEGQGLSGGIGAADGLFPPTSSTKWQNDAGEKGYYGGLDLADEAPYFKNRTGAADRLKRQTAKKTLVEVAKAQIESFNIRVNLNGSIVGLPKTLVGSSGSAGEPGVVESNSGDIDYVKSGSGGASGGSITFICTAFFKNASTRLVTSGVNGAKGDAAFGSGQNPYGGSGGGGYPGCLMILVKDRQSQLPIFAGSEYIARSGGITSEPSYNERANIDGAYHNIPNGNWTMGPYLDPGKSQNRLRNFAGSTYLTKYIASDTVSVPSPGVDPTGPADLPDDITIQEQIDTPKTPLANIVTLQVNAIPPADPNYASAYFEYRLLGDPQWIPINYGFTNTVVISPLTADGETYQISARSVNQFDEISTNRLVVDYTVAIVSKNPDEGNEAPPLPPITRLELVNRIDEGAGWDKWKGPDAIFRWAKTSVSLGGNIITPSGVTDLYLQGYKVVVFRTDTGAILREEVTKDSTYTYSLEKNRFDTTDPETGLFAPVREIDFSVQALSTSGFVGEASRFSYSNPESAAPANLVVDPSLFAISFTFTLPEDLDFVGVDLFITEAPTDPLTEEPIRIAGNAYLKEGLSSNTTYNYVLRSVDQFGTGGQTAPSGVTTTQIETSDITGLSNWATETDPVDLNFIINNMAADAVPSTRIVSVVASKITAGTITAQIELGTGVRLDGGTGTVTSINTGYVAIFGPHTNTAVPSKTLILSGSSGTDVPLWLATNGEFSFGLGDATISFNPTSGQLTFGADATIGDNTDRTVTVGAAGDYLTLDEALVALSKVVPAYKDGGFTATIQILTGTTVAGFNVDGLDLGWITLTSQSGPVTFTSDITIDNGSFAPLFNLDIVDATVTVDNGSTAIFAAGTSITLSGGVPGTPLLVTNGAKCLVKGNLDIEWTTGSNGINVSFGASFIATSGDVNLSNSTTTSGGVNVSTGSVVRFSTLDLVTSLWATGLTVTNATVSISTFVGDGCDLSMDLREGASVTTDIQTSLGYNVDGIRLREGAHASISSMLILGGRPPGGFDIDLVTGTANYNMQSGTSQNSQADGVYNSSGYILRNF